MIPTLAEAFVPPVYQGIYPSIEEISVKHLKPGHDGLLNFTFGCESPSPTGASSMVQRDENHSVPGQGCRKEVQYLPILSP
jgi:hypothetical protein